MRLRIVSIGVILLTAFLAVMLWPNGASGAMAGVAGGFLLLLASLRPHWKGLTWALVVWTFALLATLLAALPQGEVGYAIIFGGAYWLAGVVGYGLLRGCLA